MTEKLGYPHKVFTAGTDYIKILRAYEDSLKKGKEEGFLPVIVPADETLNEYLSFMEEQKYSAEDILKTDIDAAYGKRILEKRFNEYRHDAEEDFETTMEDFIGTYDGKPELIDRYSAFVDLESNRTYETILFEIPTRNPWELVAYVPFGGWNECPNTEDMLAICKYWYQKYGAIPVTIAHDVLEMSVPKPIEEEGALELAKEHYAFTPDRVDQGTNTETLSEVMESLKISKIWYFWWD